MRFARETPSVRPSAWGIPIALSLVTLAGGAVARAAVEPAPTSLRTTIGADPFVRERAAPVLARSMPLDLEAQVEGAWEPLTAVRIAPGLTGPVVFEVYGEHTRLIEEAGFGSDGVLRFSIAPGAPVALRLPPRELRVLCGSAWISEPVADLGRARIVASHRVMGTRLALFSLEGDEVVRRLDLPISPGASRRFDGTSVLWVDGDALEVRAMDFETSLGQPSRVRTIATLDRPASLGAACPLAGDAARVAIAVGDELVLLGAGGDWTAIRSGLDVAGWAPGPWSCVAGELRRVDVAHARDQVRSFVCAAEGCGASLLATPDALRRASTVHALHVGSAIVALAFGVDDRLRVGVSVGGAFAEPVALDVPGSGVALGGGAGEALAVRDGEAYAAIRTTAGVGLLRIVSTGRADLVPLAR